MKPLATISALLCLLGGCAVQPREETPREPPAAPVASTDVPPAKALPDRGPDPCPIVRSSGWNAWVNAMPGPDRPRLLVIGNVTVPSGGYRLSLTLGPSEESNPPGQQVLLQVLPPREGGTGAIVTQEVRASFPALPRYRAVIVRCGTEVLAHISPVIVAS